MIRKLPYREITFLQPVALSCTSHNLYSQYPKLARFYPVCVESQYGNPRVHLLVISTTFGCPDFWLNPLQGCLRIVEQMPLILSLI
jgi:hypothetical protein